MWWDHELEAWLCIVDDYPGYWDVRYMHWDFEDVLESPMSRELLRLAAENQALRGAMRPCLIALMSEMSEETWCAEWMDQLESRLIAGSLQFPIWNQEQFDRAALALGEVPSYVVDSAEEEYVWRPLTEEERQTIEGRMKG